MLKEWLRSTILALIFAVAIVSFVLQNAGIITVNLLFKKVETSLAIVIIVSVLIGVICTGIIAFFEQLKINRKVLHLEKKLKEYEPVYKETP